MRGTPDGFLFDMGNVLLRFCHDRMRSQLASTAGLSVEAVHELLSANGLFEAYDRGSVDDAHVQAKFEAAAGRRLEVAALHHAMSDIFEPIDGMEQILASLRRQGFRIVLLSNTNRPHFEFAGSRFPGMLSHFDGFTTSFEVGAMKPEPEIFDAALARIGLPAERVFYTDDISHYVDAARERGIDAEVFTSAEALVAQLWERGVQLTDF